MPVMLGPDKSIYTSHSHCSEQARCIDSYNLTMNCKTLLHKYRHYLDLCSLISGLFPRKAENPGQHGTSYEIKRNTATGTIKIMRG